MSTQSEPSSKAATNSPSPSATQSSAVPGPADAAIKTYLEFIELYQGFTRDPVMTVFSRMYPYYTIAAAPIFEDSLINMAAQGLAYRGTPGDPRVEVGEIRSPQEVVLISCPKESPTDPYVQYTKANGQPVPPSSSPAYQKMITMIESGGAWQIADFYSDKGVVCEG